MEGLLKTFAEIGAAVESPLESHLGDGGIPGLQ
jgi:hypothetical protein